MRLGVCNYILDLYMSGIHYNAQNLRPQRTNLKEGKEYRHKQYSHKKIPDRNGNTG